MSTPELTTRIREYKELQMFIKQLEEEAEAAKAVLIAEMQERGTDTLQADVFTVHYTTYPSNRIDTASLKKELPDVAARYAKAVEARRFQVA